MMISCLSQDVAARTEMLAKQMHDAVIRRTDRLFAGLLAFEWLAMVGLALWFTPYTWSGATKSTNPHVYGALFLGFMIVSLPVFMGVFRTGQPLTRHVIAIGQMLSSALLIHLTGGRIETHFHVFGSLAFLAFYRDWRVLITATVVAAGDHILRGWIWPESVYGTTVGTNWAGSNTPDGLSSSMSSSSIPVSKG
jgi:hypothetical protein